MNYIKRLALPQKYLRHSRGGFIDNLGNSFFVTSNQLIIDKLQVTFINELSHCVSIIFSLLSVDLWLRFVLAKYAKLLVIRKLFNLKFSPMEDNDLKLRVKKLLLHFDKNAEDLERDTGIAANTFRNIVNGTTQKIYITTVIAILQQFPGIDANWLLFGGKNMFKKSTQGNNYVNDPMESYSCKECSSKNGEIRALTQYNQMLIDKSDRQLQEIGKLKQQIEELNGRGNNRNSKQAG